MVARKRVDREAPEQKLAFEYMRLKHPLAFSHAYHVPNGGHRNKLTAARLKSEGVKAGVPDIHVALPRGNYFGLWVEMKAKPHYSSSLSAQQKEWLERLSQAGYKTAVCKGFQSFRQVIDEYMAMPEYKHEHG